MIAGLVLATLLALLAPPGAEEAALLAALFTSVGIATALGVSASFFTAAAAFTLNVIVGSIASFALSKVVAALSGNLQKPKVPPFGISGSLRVGGDVPRSVMFGSGVTAGSLVYANTWTEAGSGVPNGMLTQVIALSDVPCGGVVQLYVNGQAVNFTNPSFVNSPVHNATIGDPVVEYTRNGLDHLYIKVYTGQQTQADPFLTGTVSSAERPWQSTRIGTGICYAIVTSRINRDLFSGVPQFRFQLQGAFLYDPSKDSSVGGSGTHRWDNPASWGATNDGRFLAPVILYNLLRGYRYGSEWVMGLQGVAVQQLPAARWIAAIEAARTAGFKAGGEVTYDTELGDTVEALLASCEGRLTDNAGTSYGLTIGAPGSPVASFTDDDIIATAEQSFVPFPGLADTVNGVIFTYPRPSQAWNVTQAPPLYDAALEAEDGGRRLPVTIDMPMVSDDEQAQRLAKAALAEARRARRHTLTLGPQFWPLEPGDVISWTSARNGYEGKLFRVDGIVDLPDLDVLVDITETDPADYDWNAATDFTPPVDGFLDPVRPAVASTSVTVEAATISDGFNARRPAIRILWTAAPADALGLDWQVRLTATAALVAEGRAAVIEGASGSTIVAQGILPATGYQVRARWEPGTQRPVDWSSWLGVTTADVRLTAADLGAAIVDVNNLTQAAIDLIGGEGAAVTAAAEAARNAAQAAQAAAEDAADAATNAASAAATSATSASTSATNADGSATAAASSAVTAATQAGLAATQAGVATTKAAEATAGAASATSAVATVASIASGNFVRLPNPVTAGAVGGWVGASTTTNVPPGKTGFSLRLIDGGREGPAYTASIAGRVLRFSGWVDATLAGASVHARLRAPNGSWPVASSSVHIANAGEGWQQFSVTLAQVDFPSGWLPAIDILGAGTGTVDLYDYRVEDVTQATAAASSATAAQVSETDAETAAAAAQSARTAAEASQAAASGSASAAATSATNAGASATAANNSATSATTARNEAQAARDAASGSASAASTSASNASASATAAGNSAAASQTARTAAEAARDAASGSASAAATSATNAGASATAAGNSATAAQSARTDAESARDTAGASATTAQGAASTATTQAALAAVSASAAARLGAGNLVRTSEFTAGVGEWSIAAGTPTITTSTDVPAGRTGSALQIVWPSVSGRLICGPAVAANLRGQTVRVSMWALTNGGGSASLSLRLRLLRPNGTAFVVQATRAAASGWGEVSFEADIAEDTATWQVDLLPGAGTFPATHWIFAPVVQIIPPLSAAVSQTLAAKVDAAGAISAIDSEVNAESAGGFATVREAISAQVTLEGDARALRYLTIDANGRVASQLMGATDNGSVIRYRADRFQVENTVNGNPKAIFTVEGGEVVINGNLVLGAGSTGLSRLAPDSTSAVRVVTVPGQFWTPQSYAQLARLDMPALVPGRHAASRAMVQVRISNVLPSQGIQFRVLRFRDGATDDFISEVYTDTAGNVERNVDFLWDWDFHYVDPMVVILQAQRVGPGQFPFIHFATVRAVQVTG